MKILHIVEFGVRASGVGTVVEHLYSEQISLGHDVKIASLSENIVYKHLPLIQICKNSEFDELINSWKPNVVLFHSIWAMPYIYMSKLLLKKQIPYGVMMHGGNSKENYKKNTWKKYIANMLWFNSFLKRASGIIYLSEKEHTNCVSKNLNTNFYVMPNGCDMIDIDISSLKMHSPVNVVYIGRLDIYTKGLDYLFNALEILIKRNRINLHFSFYGNENDVDIVTVKERLSGLSKIAHFAGPAYGEKKDVVLRNADMFILTSRHEGMPMGVLEAISYGIPCLLTPGTNMSDEVVNNHAGWEALCDAEDIANTIEKAVIDLKDNYITYHQAAYCLSKKYDWKLIGKQSIEILSKMSKER